MPRILIISSGPLCRNPRVLKEATTLGRAGHDVTVATIANIERFEAYDRELLLGKPFRKVALERAPTRPLPRFVAFYERLLSWSARRALRFGIESPISLGPYSALLALAARLPADLDHRAHGAAFFHRGKPHCCRAPGGSRFRGLALAGPSAFSSIGPRRGCGPRRR